MIEVSIIIVNWNTKLLTQKCIESILKSNTKSTYEIILVDNYSSDGSVKIFREYLKAKKINKLIENNSNLGFSKANNKAIEVARGKNIFLLNSDTEIKNGAIDELVNFANANKNIGVIGSRLFNADGSIQASCFNLPTLSRAVRQYWLGQRGVFDKYYPKEENPTKVEAVVGAAMFVTENSIKKVGLLSEKYFFYFEDLDYCRAVAKAGLSVYYLPSSHVIHYHGSSINKITDKNDAWKKLIPGSKIYHGTLMHYLINLVIWSGQKWQKFFKD